VSLEGEAPLGYTFRVVLTSFEDRGLEYKFERKEGLKEEGVPTHYLQL